MLIATVLLAAGLLSTKTLERHKEWERWLVPTYMYSKQFFPQFLSGSGYIMSLKVAECLLQKSRVRPERPQCSCSLAGFGYTPIKLLEVRQSQHDIPMGRRAGRGRGNFFTVYSS